MSNGMPWFRFYSEALDDRKVKRICRIAQQPKAVVLGVWITLLCLANDSPERGKLMFSEDMWLTEEEIAAETGLDPIAFGKIIKAFQSLNMVTVGAGYEITNWDDRQFDSDNSTARVRRWRRKKRQEKARNERANETSEPAETGVKQNETLLKRYSNIIDTDTDTDTDTHSARAHEGREMSEEIWNGCVDVMEKFSDKTGIKLPDLSKNIRRNAENWVSPANEIMLMCDDEPDEAASLVASVIEYMDENGLTYANVGSTVNIARRIQNGGANGSGPESTMWDEHIFPYHDKQKPFDELPDEAKKIVRQLGGDDVQSISTKKLRIRYYTGE